MYVKTRYQRATKGENAEVYVANPVAYTTQATLALFEANAVEGEIVIYDDALGTLYGGRGGYFAVPANVAAVANATGGALAAATYYYASPAGTKCQW